MRASECAMAGMLLAIAIARPRPAVAEYPFDSLPALPPLAAANSPNNANAPIPGNGYSQSVTTDSGLAYDDGYVYEGGYGPPGGELDYPPSGGGPPGAPLPMWQHLFPGPPPLWVGFLSSTYMGGTERSIWNGNLFLPLWQDGQTLWYGNIRGQVDNDDAGEFNIGTGVRVLAQPGLVLGTYIFYDRLHSSNDNGFSQGTFGVEVMDVCWDARFNIYFPESKGKSTSPPVARYSNGNVVVSAGEERAYWGFDLETGALLGEWGPNAQHELRGFCGIYHFDHSAPGFDNITGPRARLEWRYHDIPMFGNGSRLTCGLTVQADTERGGDAFASIGLRIPLDPWANSRPPLSRLQRRMVDPVVRDIDVVTNARQMVEPAVLSETGRPLNDVHVLSHADQLADAIPQSGVNSLVVIDGGDDELVSRESIHLRPGQMIYGGGTELAVKGAQTGRSAIWTTPGSRPTIAFDPNHCPPGEVCAMVHRDPGPGFILSDSSQLVGLNIRGGLPAVLLNDAENVSVSDIRLQEIPGGGEFLINSEGTTFNANSIGFLNQ